MCAPCSTWFFKEEKSVTVLNFFLCIVVYHSIKLPFGELLIVIIASSLIPQIVIVCHSFVAFMRLRYFNVRGF